jgi:hypothetical protein
MKIKKNAAEDTEEELAGCNGNLMLDFSSS